jgi:hypothetical protein
MIWVSSEIPPCQERIDDQVQPCGNISSNQNERTASGVCCMGWTFIVTGVFPVIRAISIVFVLMYEEKST